MFLADKTTVADEKLVGKLVICIDEKMMTGTGSILVKSKTYTVVAVEQKGKCDRANAFFPEHIDTWIVTKEDPEGRWRPDRFAPKPRGLHLEM